MPHISSSEDLYGVTILFRAKHTLKAFYRSMIAAFAVIMEKKG